jgi:hypothetical protein
MANYSTKNIFREIIISKQKRKVLFQKSQRLLLFQKCQKNENLTEFKNI